MRTAIVVLLCLLAGLAYAQQQPTVAQLGNSICQAVIQIVQANERQQNQIEQMQKEIDASRKPPAESKR